MEIIDTIKWNKYGDLSHVKSKNNAEYLRLSIYNYGVKVFSLNEKEKAIYTFLNDTAFMKESNRIDKLGNNH